jgi:hypothetical protein
MYCPDFAIFAYKPQAPAKQAAAVEAKPVPPSPAKEEEAPDAR